jgi:hypothetical protein
LHYLYLLTLPLPLTASANWSAGAGHANFSDNGASLDAAYASMSYLFPKQDGKFVVISELPVFLTILKVALK